MKRVEAILVAGLAISLSGCFLGRKPKVVKAAPPPPKPAAAPAPAPLPQPLSIPQTRSQLPPPQPVTPEALATTVPHEETPSTPAPVPDTAAAPRRPRPSRRWRRRLPPVATPPAEERPPIQEELTPAEKKRLSTSPRHEAAKRPAWSTSFLSSG